MERITTVGIDLAKNVFEVCGRDGEGHVVIRKRLRRAQVLGWVSQLKPCVIGMEACGGAHEWARRFRTKGHEVKLMAPQFVKAYVKSHKTDRADAEAISEAVGRPTMRFVPVKSVEQQDVLCLHRIRERLVRNRTALVNEVRGLLGEYGIVIPEGIRVFRRRLRELLAEAESGLTLRSQSLMEELWKEFEALEQRIEEYERRIGALYRASEVCQRLGEIPGVGPITATAVVATVGDARVFRRGREFSAYLGLVPRQHSSGGKTQLLGISKRGNTYVRKLLVHGARAVLQRVDGRKDRTSRWVAALQARRGFNRACVALANKNARRIWALLVSGQVYQTERT